MRLKGASYTALICAHAAIGGTDANKAAAALADEACELGEPLGAEGYLASLASVRDTKQLRRLVDAMCGAPRFGWLRRYADSTAASWGALGGALTGGRRAPALARASAAELRAALQALNMLESSVGGVSALLWDLRATEVLLDAPTRSMLLSSALLEGWLQQQVACTVWLPLLSPQGDAVAGELGASLRFVRTPGDSGFKNAWCFQWGGADVHPVLRAWTAHRTRTDGRFAHGLCPIDVGVYVLEGLLLAARHGAFLRGRAKEGARTRAVEELTELRLALRTLIVRLEGDAPGKGSGGGGFGARRGAAAATGPALGSLRGLSRELLIALDLQNGLRYAAQLQSAKLFCANLEELLGRTAPESGEAAAQGGGLKGATSKPKGKPWTKPTPKAGGGKGSSNSWRMTKREQKLYSEMLGEGLVGFGAVDPSPQRTTTATAAVVALLSNAMP